MGESNMKMPTTYLVAVEFETEGLVNANDITADRDQAYDDWADQVSDGHAARAFVLEFDVETNAPETFREITDEFETEYHQICVDRGLPWAAE
jgi:hypothetical protein